MAASGITVADSAVTEFQEFKKSSNAIRFLTFKIEGDHIVMEHRSEATSTFDDLIASLPANDCRFVLYKCDFLTNDGRPGQKICNIMWYVAFC